MCTLIFLLFVASFLSVSTLSTLLFGRLLFLVRASGPRDGVTTWKQEVLDRLQPHASIPSPDDDRDDIVIKSEEPQDQTRHKNEDGHISDSGSTVVVEGIPEGAKIDGVKTEQTE